MSKIGFERFTAMSDQAVDKVQACGNRHMSVAWRLWEITLCHMNNWGHAPFDPRQLQMLICGATGEPERRAVDRGFKNLKALGRIAPESTPLCVVVNDDMWRRGAGKGKWDDTCSEPSHRPYRRHVWSAKDGWKTARRHATAGTATVGEIMAGVPEMILARDPWAADGE